MRQLIAWLVGVLTMGLLVGLALLFASAHNPPRPGPTPPVVAVARPLPSGGLAAPQREVERGRASHAITPSADPKRGRAIYERENCSTCHAIAGTGNPRTPLDGVGKRLNDEELKAWITGAVVAVDGLSPSIVKRKQRYRELPESDLADVVAYLSHLEE